MTENAFQTSDRQISATGLMSLPQHRGTQTNPSVKLHPIGLREFLSRELALVPDVEAVLTAQHGTLLHIWTVVNGFDESVRRKIYEREKAIIDEFPRFEFDFNIFTRNDRDLGDLTDLTSLEVTFNRL